MRRFLLISLAVLTALWGCRKELDERQETGAPLQFAPQVDWTLATLAPMWMLPQDAL